MHMELVCRQQNNENVVEIKKQVTMNVTGPRKISLSFTSQ